MTITPHEKAFRRTALSFGVVLLAGHAGAALAAPGDAIGPQFLVNTSVNGFQQRPAVARSASGQRVVAWDNDTTLYAQRYAADGSRAGGEIRVNTSTAPGLRGPAAVATDAAGNFTVAWSGSADSVHGVIFRRFAADGTPLSEEVLVDAAGAQPSIAMDADGDTVVAWFASDSAHRGRNAIFARRYGPDGSPLAAAVKVSPNNLGQHIFPEVAMSSDGDYVVAWTSYGQIGTVLGSGYVVVGGGVLAQSRVWTRHYNADGSARTVARPTVTLLARDLVLPGGAQVTSGYSVALKLALAMDEDGDYAVTWAESSYGVKGDHVRFRRFSAADVASRTVLAASLSNADVYALYPAVAINDAGDLVVSWQQVDPGSTGADNTAGIYFRRFEPGGAPRAPVQLVPLTDHRFSGDPAVSVSPSGDFTMYWDSNPAPGDGSGSGVLGQAFEGP